MTRCTISALALVFCLRAPLAVANGPAPGSVLDAVENPNPMSFDTFGAAVQVIGSEFAVAGLGAKNGPFYEGAVYLFDGTPGAEGQLLHEIRRPTLQDADRFGHALASSGQLLAVADPRYIIGPTFSAGAVHIYDTANGQFVRSILNPTPASLDLFSWDITTVGSTLIVSELTEQAHDAKIRLYDMGTGGLLQTISKPVGADVFGTSVAAGNNQIYVGGTISQVGAVFTFDATDGHLIRTFMDPTPIPFNNLDTTLVAVGNKLVIGGMSEEAYVTDVGTGALLRTIADPGSSSATFGTSLAAYGDDLLIASKFGPQVHVVDLDTGNVLLSFLIPQATDFPPLVGAFLSMADLNGNILVGHPAWRAKPRGPVDEGRVFLVAGVPEPSTASLLAGALILCTAIRKRARR